MFLKTKKQKIPLNLNQHQIILKKNYEGLNHDNSKLQVAISPAYLKKCISDPQKRVDLEKTLKFNLSSMKEWDQMLALRGQELKFMKKEIDEDGNVNTTKSLVLSIQMKKAMISHQSCYFL